MSRFTGLVRKAWRASVNTPHMLVALIASITIAALMTGHDVQEILRIEKLIGVTNDLILTLQKTATQLTIAETGQRGYIITADPKYMSRYNAAIEAIEPGMENTADLLREDAQQRAVLRSLHAAVIEKVKEMQHGIDARTLKGFSDAQEAVRSDHGYTLMEKCLDLMLQLRQNQQHLLKEKKAIQTRKFNRLVIEVIFFKAATLLAIYACWQWKVAASAPPPNLAEIGAEIMEAPMITRRRVPTWHLESLMALPMPVWLAMVWAQQSYAILCEPARQVVTFCVVGAQVEW